MKTMFGLGAALALAIMLSACGGKQSAVEGKLVDWNGRPVAGVKIIASQVQLIKGYEHFEAVTKADGAFRLTGMFPSSKYILKPWSDKWTCETAVDIETAPQSETAILPTPIVIAHAFSKSNGSLVMDLATGKPRFSLTTEPIPHAENEPGMAVLFITDAQTGLDWIVGPNLHYGQATQWVRGCNVAGGGWRMPTLQELKALYEQGVGERNIDPAFKISFASVWGQPHDEPALGLAWFFDFTRCHEWGDDAIGEHGVFGVRKGGQSVAPSPGAEVQMSEGERKQLESLGYLGGDKPQAGSPPQRSPESVAIGNLRTILMAQIA